MRVTVVSRIYLPEPAAASYRLAALVSALRADGDHMTVLTTKPGKTVTSDPTAPEGAEPAGRVRVKRWPVLRDSSGYVRGYVPYLSFDLPVFFRVLFSPRPDVLVVEPPPTTGTAIRVACGIRRIPYVYYGADIWSDAAATTGASAFVVGALRKVERWVWRGATTVLSVSAGVTERMRELEPTVKPDEIGNGIDTELFTPGDEPPPASEERYFLYAGTASEWHGAGIFAAAMRRVHSVDPSLRLIYLGHGAQTEQIKQSCADLPPGVVQFLPRAAAAETAVWLRGAVAAVASVEPGRGYDFAFPSKALAAAACGTPVVYAGAGPAGEVITEAGLGAAVEMDESQVAAALLAAAKQAIAAADSPDEMLAARQRRRGWVIDNASLGSVALRAAAAVHRAARIRRLSTKGQR